MPRSRVVVLVGAPVVDDTSGDVMPIAQLNAAVEVDAIGRALRDAARAIELDIEYASSSALARAATMGCLVLHYTGHASSVGLTVEDGVGATHIVLPYQLRELFGASQPPTVVVLSACDTSEHGDAIAAAGIAHVVAVTGEVAEDAASVFAESFYRALALGGTVIGAFQVGRAAVLSAPLGAMAEDEARKFTLLPADARHEERPFETTPRGTLIVNSADSRAASLPRVPAHFVGRFVAIHDLLAALQNGRLVTVIGAPGIGKSTLAIAVANHVARRKVFEGGVAVVRLRDVASGESVRAAIAASIGAHIETDQQLVGVLSGSRRLLILDNAEDILEHRPQDLRKLIELFCEQTPATLLVTSRVPLGGGLAGVVERLVRLSTLEPDDAASLFEALHPHPVSKEAGTNGTTLRDKITTHPVLEYLSGHPQAISLAVPLLDTLTLDELHEALQEHGDAVLEVPGLLPSEQDSVTSLSRALATSVSFLERRHPKAALLFASLGLFPGGMLAPDLDAVLGERWHEPMHMLRRASLVQYDQVGDEEAVYSMFPFVTSHALRRVSVADRREVGLKALGYFASMSRWLYETSLRKGWENAARLQIIHEPNIIACLLEDRPQRGPRGDELLSPPAVIGLTLSQLMLAWHRTADGFAVVEKAREACDGVGDRLGALHLLQCEGELHAQSNRHDRAEQCFAAVLREATDQDSRVVRATTLKARGMSRLNAGRLALARDDYEEALRISRSVGNDQNTANALCGLAEVEVRGGRRDRATSRLNEALSLYVHGNDSLGEANVLRQLGDVHCHDADLDGSAECYTRSRVLYNAIGHELGEANSVRGLADVARRRRNIEEALEHAEWARDVYQRLGNQAGLCGCDVTIAHAHSMRDEFAEAQEAAERAKKRAEEAALPLMEGHATRELGRIAEAKDDLEVAIVWYAECRGLYERAEDEQGKAEVVLATAHCMLRLDKEQAEPARSPQIKGLLIDAMVAARAVRDGVTHGNALALLGDLSRRQDRLQRALLLYRAALRRYLESRAPLGTARVLLHVATLQCEDIAASARLKLLQAAIAIHRAQGNEPAVAHCIAVAARIASDAELAEETAYLADLAAERHLEVGDLEGAAASLLLLRWAFAKLGKGQAALATLFVAANRCGHPVARLELNEVLQSFEQSFDAAAAEGMKDALERDADGIRRVALADISPAALLNPDVADLAQAAQRAGEG